MLLPLAFLSALASPSLALVDIHVDASADCAAADGSLVAPFCTLQEALAIAGANDRILVAPGSYPGGLIFDVDVTVVGTGGREATVIDAASDVNAATIVAGATVAFEGLTLRGATGRGVVVNGDLTLSDVTVSGCASGGLLVTGASSSLFATDSTIEENLNDNFGAGIYIEDSSDGAELVRCDIADNVDGFEGGGILALADLTMIECTVRGNVSGSSGAGVMAFLGNVRIESCLIEGNETVAFGAGLYARNLDSMALINTTISGNLISFDFGGGVGAYVDTVAAGSMVGCSVVNNSGAPGAGMLFINSPAVTIEASVISGNTSPSGIQDLEGIPSSPIVSAGSNVIGDATFFSSTSTDVFATDPRLAPLAFNGGRTMTHAPISGSPCLGTNVGSTLAVDQRGAARSGSSQESGAFELIGDPAFCGGVPNSTLEVATLQASGDQVAANGAFSLHSSSVPAGSFAYFLTGDGTQSSTPMGSQGVFCIGGMMGSFNRAAQNEVKQADESGRVSLTVDLADVPSGLGSRTILAGDTRYFQLWFRDRNPMPTSNFSLAIGVTFE